MAQKRRFLMETIIGLSLLAFVTIGYAVSRIPRKARLKFVDQKVKDCSNTAYTVVVYI
jgi:hypothetical protein